MRYSILSLLLTGLFFAGQASASCTTVGFTTTCSDGNTYQKFGNTTYGSNANTGSTWNQTTIGNTTYGTDSRGRSWNITRDGNGNSFGTDASGNPFSCFGSNCIK